MLKIGKYYKPSIFNLFEDKDTILQIDEIRLGNVEYTNVKTGHYASIPIKEFNKYYEETDIESGGRKHEGSYCDQCGCRMVAPQVSEDWMNKEEVIRAIGELFFEKMQSGECLTNGEVIQALFPNLNFTNVLAKMYAQNGKILLDWWNAPYKAEIEPQESEDKE